MPGSRRTALPPLTIGLATRQRTHEESDLFLPPEQRHPGPPPWDPRPPKKRAVSSREETILLWVIGFLLVMLVLAPIAGGTLLDAIRYTLRH